MVNADWIRCVNTGSTGLRYLIRNNTPLFEALSWTATAYIRVGNQLSGHESLGKIWLTEDTHRIRQTESAPLTKVFKDWLDAHLPTVPPKSAIGKLIGYCINQWDKLRKFLDHPDVPICNNRVENDIRPFALGRRVWLFCDSIKGAQASANLYSVVGTCRANGIEPHAYLAFLYAELPKATTLEHVEALLPWNVTKAATACAVKEPISALVSSAHTAQSHVSV